MQDELFQRIDGKTDELVDLTRELIGFPTVNPPGEGYAPCAEFLGRRLAGRGFEVGYHRAEGAVGDSLRYPRTNVVARLEGRGPGPCVHFNGHIDVVPAGRGWSVEPFAGEVRARLAARRGKTVFNRANGCHIWSSTRKVDPGSLARDGPP